jgi:hypothetical protein
MECLGKLDRGKREALKRVKVLLSPMSLIGPIRCIAQRVLLLEYPLHNGNWK